MIRRTVFSILLVLAFSATFMSQAQTTPPTPPLLNAPDDPPCTDPLDIVQCSQDFYWEQPQGGEPVGWYEVFRRTESQQGDYTAWVLVGTTTETRWWTALDAGDSERNQAGEVRAGQQKPGFVYHYRVRSCRLISGTWTISCSAFSTSEVVYQGVSYQRVTQ